jgi:hypothetical protein
MSVCGWFWEELLIVNAFECPSSNCTSKELCGPIDDEKHRVHTTAADKLSDDKAHRHGGVEMAARNTANSIASCNDA